MGKKILLGLVVAGALYLGIQGWISSRGERYVTEILDAYNRVVSPQEHWSLKEYKGGFRGGRALLVLEMNNSEPGPFLHRLELESRVDYGPFFWRQLRPGLVRLEVDTPLKPLLQPEAARRIVGSASVEYRGILDWGYTMHETLKLSPMKIREENATVESEAVVYESDYRLSTLQGRGLLRSDRLIYRLDGREDLGLDRPRLAMRFEPWKREEGWIFGDWEFRADELRLRSGAESSAPLLHFRPEVVLGLHRKGKEYANARLALEIQSRDEATRKYLGGISQLSLNLELRSLGRKGLEVLRRWKEEAQKTQRELSAASASGDDIALQKAILAFDALEGRWIEVYNTLLVPGRTRLLLKEHIGGDHRGDLRLDLTFTGKKIRSDNPISATVDLLGQLERIVEGSFALEIDKELAKRLYPHGVFVLDAMTDKGLASLDRQGVYHLKGEIRGGKIIINGTRYAPHELVMMILI
ncbi:DUF945 family protein [Nitratifractor sp.]